MYVYNELLADKYIIKAPYNCTNEFYEIVVAAPELYVQNLWKLQLYKLNVIVSLHAAWTRQN